MAFKRIVSLSYPEYTTEISIDKASDTETRPLLPVGEVAQSRDSAQNPDSR